MRPKVIKHKKVSVGKFTYEITKMTTASNRTMFLVKRSDVKKGFGKMLWSLNEVKKAYPNLAGQLDGF